MGGKGARRRERNQRRAAEEKARHPALQAKRQRGGADDRAAAGDLRRGGGDGKPNRALERVMALRRAVAAHRAAEESPGTLPAAETAAGRSGRGSEAGGRGAAPTAAALPDSIAATARRDGPAADPAAALPSGRSAPPAAADGIGPGKPAAGAPPPRVKRKKAYRQRRQERQAAKKRARADAAATAAGGPRDELLFFDEVAYRPPDLTVKNRRAKTQAQSEQRHRDLMGRMLAEADGGPDAAGRGAAVDPRDPEQRAALRQHLIDAMRLRRGRASGAFQRADFAD